METPYSKRDQLGFQAVDDADQRLGLLHAWYIRCIIALLYGRVQNAFKQLQHQMINQSRNDSILAWTADQQMSALLFVETNYPNAATLSLTFL